MKNNLCILSLILMSAVTGYAQENMGKIGYGIAAGAVNYAGDLDGNFAPQYTRFGAGIHATGLISSRLHVRLAYFHGQVGAHDGGRFDANNKRNLDFFSNIDELSLGLVYKFYNRRRDFASRNFLTPYVFAGIGGFSFNPKTTLNGKTYALQEIGTEGQYLSGNYPKPYKLQQVCIPFGAGFLIRLSRVADFGGECGFRKTFTDYLDDVSTFYPDKEALRDKQGDLAVQLSDRSTDPEGHTRNRGNPSNKDWYVFTNLHLTFYFNTTMFKTYKLRNQYKDNSCRRLIKAKKL